MERYGGQVFNLAVSKHGARQSSGCSGARSAPEQLTA